MAKHQCHRCERSFGRLDHLNRHERSHTKEKPYLCSFCPKAFTRRDLLTRHLRLCHQPVQPGQTRLHSPQPSPSLFNHPPVDSLPVVQGPSIQSQYSAIPSSIANESFAEGDMQYPINDLATSLQLSGEDDTVSGSRGLTQSAPTDLFDNYDWSTIFQDENFGEIMDDVVFPDPAYSLSYDTTLLDHNRHNPTSASMFAQNRRANGPTSQPLRAEPGDLSRFGSRLPSLDPEDRQQQRPEAGGQGVEDHSSPWQQSRLPHCLREVTSTCRQRMVQELANFTNVVPARFELPSRHTLTRFVAMYIAGFNDHNPVLHLPTLALDSIAVELFLSIASIGARYAHEREASLDLFEVARAVAFERVKRTTDCSAANVPTQVSGAEEVPLSDPLAGSVSRDCWDDQMRVEVIQTLVLMIGSLWFGRTPGARSGEAASFRSLLEVMIRDLAESATACQPDASWEQWVRQETIKRIVLVTFTLMNLQTIILDCAPSLWWTEVLLDLPCSEEMWNAKTPELWNLARARDTTATSVQTTMQNLFYTDPRTYRPFFSSLGGYFLIHAILQSIWILQQSRRLRAESANAQAQDIKHIQQALRQWRRGWERNQESSMNPISPSGPLTFTSTALLRLAYVRITTDTRFIPSLNTWNPNKVVKLFLQTPSVERSEQATRAALHCAHALSIPVKIGLNFVARTQSFYWASQHALCSLECALFLSKWLTTITGTRPTELTKEETLVLDFVIQIVAETPHRSSHETLLRTDIRLSKTVVSTWATLYPGGNVWEMVDLVGNSMKACADATCTN